MHVSNDKWCLMKTDVKLNLLRDASRCKTRTIESNIATNNINCQQWASTHIMCNSDVVVFCFKSSNFSFYSWTILPKNYSWPRFLLIFIFKQKNPIINYTKRSFYFIVHIFISPSSTKQQRKAIHVNIWCV